MRILWAVGVALSLGCISAGEAPWQYQTYSGVRVDSDPAITARFDRAMYYCRPEAASYNRGSPDPFDLVYVAALRQCLYRHNFVDRGAYAYPASAVFQHFLDR